MVTKALLNQLFSHQISQLTFKEDESGDMFIEGKRSRVVLFEESGLIDVFFGPDLHGGSLTRFERLMADYAGRLLRWGGEAAFQTRDPKAVLDNLKFLGIRRKRRITEELRERGRKLAAGHPAR